MAWHNLFQQRIMLFSNQINSCVQAMLQQQHNMKQRQFLQQQQQQSLKVGSPQLVSSPQLMQAPSPQMSQQMSPQTDQTFTPMQIQKVLFSLLLFAIHIAVE